MNVSCAGPFRLSCATWTVRGDRQGQRASVTRAQLLSGGYVHMTSARLEGSVVRTTRLSRIGVMPGGGNTSLHFTSLLV